MTDATVKTALSKALAKRRAAQPSSAAETPAARKSARAANRAKANLGKTASITYVRTKGVDAFVTSVARATPMEIVEVERHGLDSIFLKDLSKHMNVPAVRLFEIVGIPKATAEKKVAANEPIAGAGGQAALGIARLLAIAKGIVENSTAEGARSFDVARWLGEWIERPQPALGGRKPADLIGTPTGLDMVARVLGAIESGAYQ